MDDDQPDEQRRVLARRVERGTAALIPFVQRWDLSLNPEDLAEIAYAVLQHADTTTGYEEIHRLVNEQLDEHQAKARSLYADLRAERDG